MTQDIGSLSRSTLLLLALATLMACGSEEAQSPPPPPVASNTSPALPPTPPSNVAPPSNVPRPTNLPNNQQPVIPQANTPVLTAAGSMTPAGGSNFGTIRLRPGFSRGPRIARGVSGGVIDARGLNSTCRGWISQQPDHIFVAEGAFRWLQIFTRSNEDTTLVIQGGDGSYHCDDDSGGSLNPKLSGNFSGGSYRIWVGSYRQGVRANYTLGFSIDRRQGPNSIPLQN